MNRRIGSWLAGGILLGAISGCTRLETAPQDWPELPADTLATAALPVAWGRLVAVSADPRVDRLWFQNDAGEIRVAFFDHGRNRIWGVARVIHRN